jgi:lipopolysaccharide export system protein LptC
MRVLAIILCGILLTGCITTVKTVYVKPTIPPLPDKPQYYQYQFDQNLCLDEKGAKALLKNKALTDDYITQLESIINSLRP